MSIALGTLYAFGLVLLRTAGLCISIPSWGSRQVPARVRLALVLVLSFAVFEGSGATALTPPSSWATLMGAALWETGLGLLGGLSARLTLEAAAAAGGMISTATGLSYGALVDPLNGAESNALGQLLRLLALAAAMELGLHREAIFWLQQSLLVTPVSAVVDLNDGLLRALTQGVYCAALAVRVAFPVLALVGLSHLALGAAGRLVPQLGLQNVGFSLAVLVGGASVYALAPEAARRLGSLAAQSFALR